jgi:hypothetical protein
MKQQQQYAMGAENHLIKEYQRNLDWVVRKQRDENIWN